MYDLIHGYFYVGSTTDKLSKRFSKHKQDAKIYPDRKVYKVLGDIGWENVKMILMEEHYLENKEQQLREEDRVIQMFWHDEKCLNSLRPHVPVEEQLTKKKEKYYIEHDKNMHRMKEYYKDNVDAFNSRSKEYYRTHTQEILNYQHIYRNENRQKMRDRDNEKYTCGCGTVNSHGHKARHEQSKKTSSMAT